jgi:hypothetical protein
VPNPYNDITRDALRNTDLPRSSIYGYKTSLGIIQADEEVQRGRSTEDCTYQSYTQGCDGVRSRQYRVEEVHREKVIGSESTQVTVRS